MMFQIMESITAPIKRLFPATPNHTRYRPIVEMIAIKTRSPREVAMGKNPFRFISGENVSHKLKPMIVIMSTIKKTKLGQVQYIHWNSVFNHSNKLNLNKLVNF